MHSKFRITSILFKKKNGELRLVVYYRELNAWILAEKFVITKIWDQLAQLEGSKVFSQIDSKSRHYQIRMAQKEKIKTVFIIANRTYLFLKMPFGLNSALSIFQTGMVKLFGNLKYVAI